MKAGQSLYRGRSQQEWHKPSIPNLESVPMMDSMNRVILSVCVPGMAIRFQMTNGFSLFQRIKMRVAKRIDMEVEDTLAELAIYRSH